MSDNDLNDDLSDLLGYDAKPGSVVVDAMAKLPPSSYVENCPACGGTGRWRGTFSGSMFAARPCYKCKATGKISFKTDPATRQKSRESSMVRREKLAHDNVEFFAKSEPAVYEWMLASKISFPFAASLLETITKYGSLTEKQLAAAYRCVARAASNREAAQTRKDNAKSVDSSKLIAAFSTASEKLKKPKIHLAGFSIYQARPDSKIAGSLIVYGNGYLGRITNEKFIPSRHCDSDTETKVIEVVNDPQGAAIAYGRMTGNCAICNRLLTVKESVERGIGPICAERFGW